MKIQLTMLAMKITATIAIVALAISCDADARAQTSFGKMRAAQTNPPEEPEIEPLQENASQSAQSKPTNQASKVDAKEVDARKGQSEKIGAQPSPENANDARERQTSRNAANPQSQDHRIAPKSGEKIDDEPNDVNKTSEFGPKFGKPVSHKYRAGMIFQAQLGGTCVDVLGTAPVPMEFPEQKVRTLAEDFPAKGRVDYRNLKEGGARQLVFKLRELKEGNGVEATALFEVVRYPMTPPDNTTVYEIPKSVPYDVKRYLKDGKYMQSGSRTVKTLAKECTQDYKYAWEKVDSILAYVRTNIQYKETQIEKQMRGALDALKTRDGDCEDMSALFIAMCRAIDVPARLVRVPGHCWAEFYLVDPNKKGHWFPAQVAGTDRLGELQDDRVILQKGDSFRLPETPKEEKLYVTELFTGTVKNNGPEPKHVFIQEVDGKESNP